MNIKVRNGKCYIELDRLADMPKSDPDRIRLTVRVHENTIAIDGFTNFARRWRPLKNPIVKDIG